MILLLYCPFRSRFLSFDLPSNFVISLVLLVLLSPSLSRPPSDFDKLDLPTFPSRPP